MSGHETIYNDSQLYIVSSDSNAVYVYNLVLPDDICSIYSSADSAVDCLSQRGCHSCNDSSSGYHYCFDKNNDSPPTQ